MSLLQVAIDTNVIISGLRSNQGSAFQVLRLIGKEQFDLNISVPLILEYNDVLLRQSSHLGLLRSEIESLLDYYCSIGNKHKIYYLWRPVLQDPKDEMVLELAVKAQCKYIITFNKRDFGGSEKFGVIVLTPNEFLKEIGAWKL